MLVCLFVFLLLQSTKHFQDNLGKNGECYAKTGSQGGGGKKKSECFHATHLKNSFQHTSVWHRQKPAFCGSALNCMQITLTVVHSMTCKKNRLTKYNPFHNFTLDIWTRLPLKQTNQTLTKSEISFKGKTNKHTNRNKQKAPNQTSPQG